MEFSLLSDDSPKDYTTNIAAERRELPWPDGIREAPRNLRASPFNIHQESARGFCWFSNITRCKQYAQVA